MQKMFASKALNDDELAVLLHNDLDHDDDLDDDDDDDDNYDTDAPKVQSSLQSAHTANLLLQALSFDASTRYNSNNNNTSSKRGLDICNVTEGVSYCYECRVHVITSGEELDRLFVDNDEEDEDEGSSMEWLRGSLLVAVDDAEDLVYQSSRSRSRQQQRKKKKKLQRSSNIPSIKEQDTGLDSTDSMDPYNETGGKKNHHHRTYYYNNYPLVHRNLSTNIDTRLPRRQWPRVLSRGILWSRRFVTSVKCH